ncbi:hypothetical protein ACFLXD_03820 [Chloroflexota bacterium]
MESKTNIDTLYQIAIDRLSAQVKTIDGIDTKIGVTFGLASGLVAALVAFVTSISKPIHELVIIFIILSACAYAATLVLLYIAYGYKKWSFNPHVKTLRDICTNPKYRDYPDIVKVWVADNCIISIESNRQPITIKLKRASRAIISVSAQGLFLVASCIFYLVDKLFFTCFW